MKYNFTRSIKNQISILTSITLIVTVVTIASVTIMYMKNKGKSDLEAYEREEMNKIHRSLENYVNMAYMATEANFKNLDDKKHIEKMYGHRLQNIIDIAASILKNRAEQVQNGLLCLPEAKQQAIAEIQAMRYDNGTGYIWMNDTTLPYPTMIMHPTMPQLNGLTLDDPKFNSAMGINQNLFQAMVQVCNSQGEGFVDYLWPKPTANGLTAAEKKLSYVYLFKEWGMVLGTGIYLDDVKKDIINAILSEIGTLRYDNGEGYFWINDTQQPYPKMVMHPTNPDLNGKILDDAKYNCAKGTNQNFFQLMVEKSLTEGSGFVEYRWPKPGSTDEEPKLSYVKYFKPLDFMIGSGVYTDHIDKAIAEKKKQIKAEIDYLVTLVVAISLLLVIAGSLVSLKLASSMSKAIVLVKNRLQDLALGKSITKLSQNRQDEIGAMTLSLNSLVDGLDAYSSFANEIGKGNLDADFRALSQEDTLGNSLIQMRKELKKVAVDADVREWINQGIAYFGDILHKYNADLQILSDQLISGMVKYMNANQGALYVLEEDKNKVAFLTMWSCYAYNRKKYLHQRIEIGEGVVGQVVLEREYIYMTDIPQGYMNITSGLGGSNPHALIVIPLITNGEVHGVLELASFNEFKPHEIEFMLKTAESIASTISSVKINEVTKKLLEETQTMTDEMRAQEEELRQNSEELQATQEALNRRLTELETENQELRNQIAQKKNA